MNRILALSRRSSLFALPLIYFLLTVAASTASDRVVFSTVGSVQFSVPEDWAVIAAKSSANRTIFAFQIKNAADEGTDDSTNLAVNSYYLKDPGSKAEFEKKTVPQSPKAQKKKLADNWDCSSFAAEQGSTPYDIWDCFRIKRCLCPNGLAASAEKSPRL
jgi:hypothetical protein